MTFLLLQLSSPTLVKPIIFNLCWQVFVATLRNLSVKDHGLLLTKVLLAVLNLMDKVMKRDAHAINVSIEGIIIPKDFVIITLSPFHKHSNACIQDFCTAITMQFFSYAI